MKNRILVPGNFYRIKARNYGSDIEARKGEGIFRMKLVSLSKNMAVFEREAGYLETFTYWDLEHRMQ